MYLVTLRVNTLRDLALLPEEFEMLECKPDTGAPLTAPPAERWNGGTRVTINHPKIPYTGNYQDVLDMVLEDHAGTAMTYNEVKDVIEATGMAGSSATQIRTIMKNHGLITKE
ncbi:hypothetical protein DRQ25_18285 [Candidatus Fermentibacteria bacterium]|nr:MAG: hypothetical protein DRQ25_18285 [Candidatus Fermentibacteria bacterium]